MDEQNFSIMLKDFDFLPFSAKINRAVANLPLCPLLSYRFVGVCR